MTRNQTHDSESERVPAVAAVGPDITDPGDSESDAADIISVSVSCRVTFRLGPASGTNLRSVVPT